MPSDDAPNDLQIIQARRLLEMRLNEIGHDVEPRPRHGEAALTANGLKAGAAAKFRSREGRILVKARQHEVRLLEPRSPKESVAGEGGAIEQGVAALECGALEPGGAGESGALERGACLEGGAHEIGAGEGGAIERGVAG